MEATTRDDLRHLSECDTPMIVVDGQILHRNIQAMAQRVVDLGAALRPHFKCHRSVEIARQQVEAGSLGLTCSTLRQCEVLSSAFPKEEIVVAGPLALTERAGMRLRLLERDPIFVVESLDTARRLRALTHKSVPVRIMLEVEAGLKRTGVPPCDTGSVAVMMQREGCSIVGVFAYAGGSSRLDIAAEAFAAERIALRSAQNSLAKVGIVASIVSAGSSPTMPFAQPGLVTEYRPGTYVFGDRQQVALGSTLPGMVAASVVATVVSVHRDHVVVDAGASALGRESYSWLEGFGELPNGDRLTRLYDYQAVIDDPSSAYRIGDRVSIVPNNVNSAVSLHSHLWLSDEPGSARPIPVVH